MASFEDLGLREALLRTLEDEEIEQPTAVQEALIPPLRRGGNVVARASSGSGKTLAYALGILDHLAADETGDDSRDVGDAGDSGDSGAADTEDVAALRMLVVTPSQDEAEHIARDIFSYVQAVGLAVTVPGGGWGTQADAAEVVVAAVADVVDALRGSLLKLENLEALVVDGAAAIEKLGDWAKVETVLDSLHRDTQRVFLSSSFEGEVADTIERRVKRAIHYPPEAAVPDRREPELKGQIGYVLVAGHEKLDVLARQLSSSDGSGPPPVIFCRNDERAAEVAEVLATRGFIVGAADDTEADVAIAAADETRATLARESSNDELGQSISFDVPADAATLLARHDGDADGVVLVEPRQLAHLTEIARQAGWGTRPLPLPVRRSASVASLAAFRSRVRRALAEEDLTAQFLVLEPLFAEFSAAEVAAALGALLRQQRPEIGAAPQQAAPVSTAPAAAPRAETGGTTGPAPTTWTRLYVGVGSRDDLRPGDLVGALTGEANINGSEIGKIDIRDSFSVVEVQSAVAERVIKAVNGTTIRGRSARVDYDRGGKGGRSGPPRRSDRGGERGGGERRVVRRPRPPE